MTGDAWPGYEIMLNRLRRTLAMMIIEQQIPDRQGEAGQWWNASKRATTICSMSIRLCPDRHPPA